MVGYLWLELISGFTNGIGVDWGLLLVISIIKLVDDRKNKITKLKGDNII
ncbi:hypothetical protein IE5_02217 [Bacillus cereus BAG3X2-2]|nr:hypothetical protein IE5_02217 [Bacillus cereus BAG3X2-2]